jgi:hypothetical protein
MFQMLTCILTILWNCTFNFTLSSQQSFWVGCLLEKVLQGCAIEQLVAPPKIFLLLYIPHEKIQLLMNIVSFKFDKEAHPHT